MEDGARKLVVQVVAALVVFFFCYPLPTFAQGASGELTVNGQTFTLRHSYASAQPAFFDRALEDIHVLLSDVPLPDAALESPFQLARLARAGGVHAVEVVLNASGEPISGALYIAAFDGLASVSGMHRFERATLERLRVAGRLFTEAPQTFAGVTYRYDARFSAPIPRPPTAEETAAALASPPGLAARAHLEAIRKGFDPFLATLTARSAGAYRASDAADRFAELVADTPADCRVVSLTGTGSTRTATVQGTRTRDGMLIEFSFTLRQEGQAWKVER